MEQRRARKNERRRERQRLRYAADLEYREKHLAASRRWKKANSERVAVSNEQSNPGLIAFQSKKILLPENPRRGICSRCGRIRKPGERQFDLHHERYDVRNPAAFTVELCQACHGKRTTELKKPDPTPFACWLMLP